MAAPRSSSFAPSMGVVYRVHGNTTNLWTFAKPAGTAGLPNGNVLVIYIPYLSNRGDTVHENHPYLTRGEFHLGIFPLLGHELGKGTGAPHKLSAFTHFQLDIMDDRPKRYRLERKSIAWLDVGIDACDNSVAYFQIQRRKDIALFAINIVEKGNTGTAIRIVFYGSNFRGDIFLVTAKINNPVFLLVSTTDMP